MLVVALSGACQTMTGRTAGQWTDDKATTARAKTALAATKLQTLTRVDVDTVDGVVYLRGKVESAAVKNRASEVVKATTGARVVNDLMVDPAVAGEREGTPSASPTSR
jgi:hyperosmotically inducible periplasmic protein